MGALSTSIDFGGGGDSDLREQVVVGSFGRRFGDVLTLRFGAGVMTSGRVVDTGLHYDLSPGWLVSGTIAREWLGASGHGWFVSTSLTIGAAGTHTSNPDAGHTSLVAQDNRLGVVAGKTVGGIFSPYLAARAFGGPVYWTRRGENVVGGDIHHYAIGAGGSFTVGTVDIVGEATLIGEKSFTLGVNVSFWDR